MATNRGDGSFAEVIRQQVDLFARLPRGQSCGWRLGRFARW